MSNLHTTSASRDASGAPSVEEPVGASPARASPWVVSTYFAQGLPFSIVHQISAELFTALGASLSAIGLTALYGLAWNLKFVWSPAVDRIGTTRRWLVVVELVLALCVAALGWPAHGGDLVTVARGLVVIAILAATHDIAIDGFYLRALGDDQQAALSGLRVAAYRVALIVGKGALVALAGWASWRWCFTTAGGILFVLAVAHWLLLPRPEQSSSAPRGALGVYRGSAPSKDTSANRSGMRHYVAAFSTFVRRPGIVATLAFIVLFRAGDALMFAMHTPLLNSLGVELAWRGVLNGVSGAASIAGSIGGGLFIARRGLGRTLSAITLAQSVAILLYVWMAWARPTAPLILVTAVIEQLVAGVGTAALVIFVMRQCSGEYKATHFACGTALASLAATFAGSASGYLADRVGFTAFFAIAFAASLPGVLLSRTVARRAEPA